MTAINPSLREIFDFAVEKAKVIFESDGYHSPLFLLGIPDKGLGLCPLVWTNRDEKHSMLAKLAEVFRAAKGERYVGIVETWMVARQGHDLASHAHVVASECEDREEKLFIFGEDQDGTQLLGSYPIIRDKDKKPHLGPFEMMPGEGAGDFLMMDGMFPPKTKH